MDDPALVGSILLVLLVVHVVAMLRLLDCVFLKIKIYRSKQHVLVRGHCVSKVAVLN